MTSPRPSPIHFGVIGGGILGIAVARRLLQVRSNARVTVLEKEPALALHQTGRNSGVVHAGVYYAPGSLKARLCRRGVALLRDFAGAHGLTYETCGKVIVALNDAEDAKLLTLLDRSQQNGVPGIRLLTARQLAEIEPHARGTSALHSPETAIVDFTAITQALASEVEQGDGTVRTGEKVMGVRQSPHEVVVRTEAAEFPFDRVVICGGVYTDRLAQLAGDDRDPQIVPFRGEYYVLRPERRHLVRGLIYPVPDPRYPFLGVHLTRRYDGEILVGPNAVLALAREGYGRTQVNVRDLFELARSSGFRRMARSHWRMGLRELRGSLSRRAFVALAQQYVPSLTDTDVLPGPAGIRAQAVDRDGALVEDFRINQIGRVTAVRNAPSPGATSSLAIAEHIVAQIPEDAVRTAGA